MDGYEISNMLSEKLLTPNLLELIEKWARYDGKPVSAGDADIHVNNMGVFRTVTTMPKIIFGKDITFHKTKTEDYVTEYDVTMIRNICVCSDYNTRVLIAEKHLEHSTQEDKMRRPAKLWVFAVNHDGNDVIPARVFPTFEKLKEDFESKAYMPYNSLIREFCDDYQLCPYNEQTDRIFNYTSLDTDLGCLETDSRTVKASKHIEIVKRLTRAERHSMETDHSAEIQNRIAKNK